jgi:hypothetical protein
MYIKRHIEEVLRSAINEKGALCVTGARQVGKSTVLKTLFTEHRELTLDDSRLLKLALEQPDEFFARFEPPVFVDEIQYAPSLFSYVKMYIDKNRRLKPGKKFVRLLQRKFKQPAVVQCQFSVFDKQSFEYSRFSDLPRARYAQRALFINCRP